MLTLRICKWRMLHRFIFVSGRGAFPTQLLSFCTRARRSRSFVLDRRFPFRCKLVQQIMGIKLPVAQIVLGVVQNLTSLCTVVIRARLFTRNDGAVVQEMYQATAMAGQNDLLLGSFNRSKEFGVVCFLELLASLYGGVAVSFPPTNPSPGAIEMLERKYSQYWSTAPQPPNSRPRL